MTYHRTGIARLYGLDQRTFKRRIFLMGLDKVIPAFNDHKRVFSPTEVSTIKSHLGPPEDCPKYLREEEAMA